MDSILKHKIRLSADLTKLKIKHKVKNINELIGEGDAPIRWFRTNKIKAYQMNMFYLHLEQVSKTKEIKPRTIYHDKYIPNLYGVSPKERITESKPYINGELIIQDRASCFPAFILNPSKNDKVIDSCAAPGNETTHLTADVEAIPGVIQAFERDPRRWKILETMVTKADAELCVK